MIYLAKIEEIRKFSEQEASITLKVIEEGRIRMSILWYIPIENAKSIHVGAETNIIIDTENMYNP